MNKPSFTNPWFVIQKLIVFMDDCDILYYTVEDESWTGDISKAFVFTNLKAAARIAGHESGSIVRVILKEEELEKLADIQIKGSKTNE